MRCVLLAKTMIDLLLEQLHSSEPLRLQEVHHDTSGSYAVILALVPLHLASFSVTMAGGQVITYRNQDSYAAWRITFRA
jgi:hypothetical protein